MARIDHHVVSTDASECRKCGTSVSYIHVDQVDQGRSIATYCESCRRSVRNPIEEWLPFRCTLCDGTLLPSGFTYVSKYRYSQETTCANCAVNVRWSRRKTAPDWTFSFKTADRKRTSRNVEFMRMQFVMNSAEPANVAVMLLDRHSSALMLRFTSDWDRFTREQLQSISAMAEYVHLNGTELGAAELVARLGNRLSRSVQISAPELIVAGNPHALLDTLSGVVLAPAAQVEVLPVRTSRSFRDIAASVLTRPVLQPRLVLASGLAALILANIAILDRKEMQEPAPIVASAQHTSSPFIGPIDSGSAGEATSQNVRRIWKRRAAPKPAPVLEVRTFHAPKRPTVVPEVAVLTLASNINGFEAPLETPEGLFELPVLAPPRDSLAKRILQAMATPFRKVGTLFTAN